MTDPLSADQQFIQKLKTIVEANLSREEFDVEELAREAGISRSTIHKKLKHLKKQNASQFIREIRLKKALEMLQHNLGTASEVAYKVGFGSPAYFTKCFRDYYGYTPGEVKNMIIPGEAEGHTTDAEETKSEGGKLAINRSSHKFYILLLVVAAVIAALVFFFFNSGNLKSREQSIVVLPFKNFSGNPDNQYFADGIMEDILNSLYHISDLRVISRTTSEHFRATDLTALEIARRVNARNVLEGSVRQEGDVVRISVQLIDAQRDQHIWSENFDRKLANLLGVQSEIALRVANKLNAVISDSEIRQIEDLPTAKPEAYDSYMRGRFLLHRSINDQRTDMDREGLLGSIQYFEKAVASDPEFTEAYAGLAQAWFDLSAYGWFPTTQGFGKAMEYSLTAIGLDPDCAEAHTVLGAYHGWGDRQFEEARRELRIALELKPDYPIANQYYAQLLMIVGPIEETRIFLDRALKLEPHFWILHNLNAYVYYFEGKHREAIQACQTARDLHQGYLFNDWLFFLNYAKLGEAEKATGALQSIVHNYTDGGAAVEEEIAVASRESGIEGLFTWMIETNVSKPIPVSGLSGHPFFISWWYAILGDRENSIYWLERNMEQKSKRHAYFNLIVSNPDFDIVRGDPRFKAIVDKIGLTPYNNRPAR